MPAGTSHGYCLLCGLPLLCGCYVIGYEQPKRGSLLWWCEWRDLMAMNWCARVNSSGNTCTRKVTRVMTCVHLAHPRVSQKGFELVFPPALAARLIHRPLPWV